MEVEVISKQQLLVAIEQYVDLNLLSAQAHN